MAFSLVANIGAGSTDQNTFTSGSINTTGADLIVFALVDVVGAGTPSDNKGNTWTLGPASTQAPDTTIYYAKNAAVGTGHTFTVTGTGSPSLCVAAFSGSDTTANLDQSNHANANGAATVQPGSITPTAANELIIATFTYQDTTSAPTIDSGFTITDSVLQANAQHFGGGMAYKIQTTAVAVNPTWSDPNSNLNGAAIASFKAAAAAAQDTPELFGRPHGREGQNQMHQLLAQ